MPNAIKMAETIKYNETKNNQNCHNVTGASTEVGCYQMKPPTYRAYSIDVLGYVAPRTPINEKYIVTMKSQEWLSKGQSSSRILLSWNAGEKAKKCGSGVNKYKAVYNSCDYIKKGLIAYNSI